MAKKKAKAALDIEHKALKKIFVSMDANACKTVQIHFREDFPSILSCGGYELGEMAFEPEIFYAMQNTIHLNPGDCEQLDHFTFKSQSENSTAAELVNKQLKDFAEWILTKAITNTCNAGYCLIVPPELIIKQAKEALGLKE